MTIVTKLKTTTTITLLTVLTLSVGHAEIYKSVTPDGRVVYTDNADNAYKASQDTQKIVVLDKINPIAPTVAQTTATIPTSPSTNPIIVASETAITQNQPLNQQMVEQQLRSRTIRESQQGDYRLVINTPSKEMAYRRVIQNIEVEVTASPSLKVGDRFVYAINGEHLATTSDSKISLPTDKYNPEKYLLTVKIENIKGDIIATAEQPFYILSNNFAIQNQRKALAKAKADYDKLPWYKKLKININL